jgi:hemerythrin-like domain-containing protein
MDLSPAVRGAAACPQNCQENFAMPTPHDAASATWMEHRILDHVKQALRVTLDWRVPDVSMSRKLSSVQFTANSFQRHFERVMSIEEEGGYMSVVGEMKPYLHDRIERLAGDHERFRDRMRRLLPKIDNLAEHEDAQFRELCEDLRTLLDDVDEHDAKEISLLQEALLFDVGGEG